ncbi:hypothetical protein CWE22_07465 [Pseudidiomarina aestuarii]|uniref:Uncharacterized protein n=1 Tax=Pseudidiomarina aestuarii TaxID=624146 RepID=A0A7Z6ZVD4_9GAMM|nr:hypothetical protein [Pseudidiomarina aestuarii]RUO41972.1 hypothetical protein CWE22_07465 [Pseudidiomarina aestuarii]
MRHLIFLLTTLVTGEDLNLDYDIHITNGGSNVNLSVMNNELGEPIVRVINADNVSFRDEIQSLIHNDKAGAFGNVDCDHFKKMIPANIGAISDTEGTKTFAFRPIPTADDDADIYENLHGIAKVSSSTEKLISITLTNDSAFSPSFGSKIHQLSFAIECFPLTEQTMVLKNYELIVQGSAFLMPFEERMKRTYTNYRLSNPSAADHDDEIFTPAH